MDKKILIHISQLVTPMGTMARHGTEMNKVLCIQDAAVVIQDGMITAVGTTDEIRKSIDITGASIEDLSGHAVIPGLVDSHTHFIFGGYRPEEFLMRLQGTSYLEIHKQGGGIQSTVEATRAMSLNEMIKCGAQRLVDMLSMGVTTVEGKSGYGLDKDTEIRQLLAMKELEKKQPVSLISTYLGAHSIPVEYKENPDKYITFIMEEMLPKIKKEKLADFVDIFCEEGVFSIEQSRRLLKEAKKQGFNVKIHADEIASTGGAELAAEVGAASADHLLMISDAGIEKLAKTDTIATLLPCTAFCLNKPYAPARKMIDGGCAVALASDYNPGSCFTNSIPLMFALATMHMGMTLEETLCALTLNGAAALGKSNEIGSIEVGKRADMVVLSYPKYEFLVYHTCKNIVEQVIKGGETVYHKGEVKSWKKRKR